jgi:Gpi18-like mannosyltransferase
MWYRWDAGFYTSIATYGFDWINERRAAEDMAFLPVYPTAIHLVGGMTVNGCALSPYLSTCATIGGLLVSNAALLVSVFLLFDLARRRYDTATAWRAALLLLVSPISIFLSGAYTEATFLLLSLLTFWLLERDRFALAVLVACVACLTRSVGVALLLPLLWVAWHTDNAQGRGMPRPYKVLLAFLPPLVFACYILLAGLSVGDPLAYFKMYALVWNRTAGTPIQAFTVYFSGQQVALFGWDLSWSDLILTLFYLVLAVILLLREATRAWGLFALVALLIPIASGTLIGMPRFGAVIFPFYILLAKWADRLPKQVIVYGAAAALALLFIARFVTWKWIA